MKKVLWISGVVVLVLVAGVFIYLRTRKSKDFEPMIKEKLQQLVRSGSDSLYHLQLDSIEVDVLESTITVFNARLIADSARLQQMDLAQEAPDNIYGITLGALQIKGLSPLDLLDKKNISLQTIYLQDPKVQIYHKKRNYNRIKDTTTTLYQKLSKQLESFKLDTAEVKQVSVDYYDLDRQNKEIHLKDLTFRFKDILFDASTQKDTSRFLYAGEASIFVKKYTLSTADNLYNFTIDSLNILTTINKINLWGIALKPIGNKETFSKKLPYRKDRYDLQATSAVITNADWQSLFFEQGIHADQVDIYKGKTEIYSDKALPPSGQNKTGNYPHQSIMKIPLPLWINKIVLHDFEILYKEFNTKSQQMGTIQFTEVQGSLNNVTNRPDKIAVNPTMRVEADALFMGSGHMKTTWKFDMARAKEGLFTIDVNMGKMDGTALNKATMPLGMFEVKKADISSFTAFIKGNNFNANGDIKVAYDNLDVNVLKSDDGELKKKGLATFIAKTFVFQKQNPKKGQTLVAKHAYWQRAPDKSFFNLLWKTIMTGVVTTVKGD
jgi:hypothetical protein